jgi:O-antigen/teichoic acid export membrane protein
MDWGAATNGLKRYSSNTGWLLFEKAFAAFLSFLVGVYVIRYLGPVNFGIFSYALSFVSLFSGVAALGLDSIVVRDLVQNEDRNDELLGTAFVLKLFGALLVLIVLLSILAFKPYDSLTSWAVFIIAFASVFQSIFVIDFFFQSRVLSKYPVWVRCFSSVIGSAFKIILIFNHASLIWFAFAVTLENSVMALGFIIVYKKLGATMRLWRFRTVTATRLLKDSWPLILSGVAISLYMRLDQVLIRSMLDAKAVGIYAVAVNLTEIWYFIPTIVVSSLFPAIINAKKGDPALYLNLLQRLHDVFFMIAFVIGIAVSLCSGIIINTLFGESFMGARVVLIIYIWSVVFVFQGGIRGHFLILENEQQIGLWFRILAILVNTGLNLVMIPRYGIVGAAVATLLSYSLPVYLASIFHPVLRVNLLMCLRSYILPFRLAYYGRSVLK